MLIVRFVLRKMPFPALHLIILDAESSLYFQINYMSILSGAPDFFASYRLSFYIEIQTICSKC